MGRVDDMGIDLDGERGQFLHGTGQRRGVDIDKLQSGPGFGIAPGDGLADAAGSTGDKGSLSLKRDELLD